MEVGGDQSSSSNADKSCVAEAKHTTLNDEEFDDHVIDSDEYWEVMFERLKRFKEENGHCLVPSKHHADIQLSKWGKHIETNQSKVFTMASLTYIQPSHKATASVECSNQRTR